MKRYLRLGCTACKREIDRLIDLTHYTPDKCVITLGCEGRLQPLETKSNGDANATEVIGLQDWRPRGTETTQVITLSENRFLPLHTGTYGQLVLASTEEAPYIDLEFKTGSAAPRAFRQYIFRFNAAFTTVVGVESGLEKKTLRFSTYGQAPDLVEVYVNGVKREVGSGPEDYQVATSAGSGVPANAILFNSAQPAGQVDVIVSKAAQETTRTLRFTRNTGNEAREGAYNLCTSLERFVDGEWKTHYLYSYEVSSAEIEQNAVMVPARNNGDFFLLATPPYRKVDRNHVSVAPLARFSAERDYLKTFLEGGALVAKVPQSVLESVYPPLRFNGPKSPLTSGSTGSEEASRPSVVGVISGPAV